MRKTRLIVFVFSLFSLSHKIYYDIRLTHTNNEEMRVCEKLLCHGTRNYQKAEKPLIKNQIQGLANIIIGYFP